MTAASSPSNQQRAREALGGMGTFRYWPTVHRVAAALDDATVRGYNAGWEAGLRRGRAEIAAKVEALAADQ